MSTMTATLCGELEIDERKVTWRRNPFGGIVVEFDGIDSLCLPCEPEAALIRLALIGWHLGKSHGIHLGRTQMQFAIRQLIGAEP